MKTKTKTSTRVFLFFDLEFKFLYTIYKESSMKEEKEIREEVVCETTKLPMRLIMELGGRREYMCLAPCGEVHHFYKEDGEWFQDHEPFIPTEKSHTCRRGACCRCGGRIHVAMFGRHYGCANCVHFVKKYNVFHEVSLRF